MGKQRRAKQERRNRLLEYVHGEGRGYEDAVDELMVNIHNSHMERARRHRLRELHGDTAQSTLSTIATIAGALSVSLPVLPSQAIFGRGHKSKYF